MTISYPLSTPTSIGIEGIEIRAVNAVAISSSPFTYKQQVISHGGQRWEASVSIPPVRRDLSAPWQAFLLSLKGQVGTFLLGDPDYATPQGTVSSCVVSGTAGQSSVSVVMTGSLLAGDYIQLGASGNARLHQVLQDKSGSGTLEIWPSLRSTHTNTTAVFSSPKGVFRLASNSSAYSINSSSSHSISFEAIEVVT